VKAVYGKTVRTVWAADGGQRLWRASSDPTAQKRGNARGAKGPYGRQESVRGGEIRWEENPTTDNRVVAGKAMPETVKEPGLPEKVSQLRQKLSQKAKQEPSAPWLRRTRSHRSCCATKPIDRRR